MVHFDSTDASNKEILSLVLRYVDPDILLVREDSVGFFKCDSGITGRGLANKIIVRSLRSLNLDLSNLRGQVYDGAGNMAGCVNGTGTLVTNEYPQALYLHCASHCLNLAVVKSLKVTSVHNMMNVVEGLLFFLLHIQNDKEHLKTLYLRD